MEGDMIKIARGLAAAWLLMTMTIVAQQFSRAVPAEQIGKTMVIGGNEDGLLHPYSQHPVAPHHS
jgi:hypothetical protein